MRSARAALVSVLAAAVLFSTVAWADSPTALTVALHQRPPWRSLNNGAPAGADVAILAALAEQTGLDLAYKTDTLTGCQRMMMKGQADLITGLGVTEDRERYLEFITPPYATSRHIAFYAAPDRAPGITRYEHLRGFVIATVRGRSYFPQFDIDDELRKSSRASLAANFERLAAGGRHLVIIADEPHADWWLKLHPNIAARIAKAPLGSMEYSPLHIALSHEAAAKHPELAHRLGLALAHMIQSGVINDIFAEYGIRP